jgi:type IV pilus assembly protein PilV
MEVMISVVILAVGLLGVAKLQASTRQLEMEAYQRAQAMIILQDMVARITANGQAASCYAITTGASSPYVGHGGNPPGACGNGTISQSAKAVTDLTAWHQMLIGAGEVDGGVNTGAMIGARGCISYDGGSDTYTVTVVWQGLMQTAAPSAGLGCGTGTYGDDSQRRAVSAVVRIPTLS